MRYAKALVKPIPKKTIGEDPEYTSLLDASLLGNVEWATFSRVNVEGNVFGETDRRDSAVITKTPADIIREESSAMVLRAKAWETARYHIPRGMRC